MMKVAIVFPFDYKLLSAATLIDVVESVNDISMLLSKKPFFDLTLVCLRNQLDEFLVKFDTYDIKVTDSNYQANLVLIPALKTEGLSNYTEKNVLQIEWLRNQFTNGSEVASFCTGSFLLAGTGILDGKLATTHIDYCSKLIIDYPKVFVKPGRSMTADWNCYTSGGETNTYHLLIHLIQKYCGAEMAISISKKYAIELDRHQQGYFSTFRPNFSHNDVLVKQLQQKIEADFRTLHTIAEIVKEYPASRRNLVRKFKANTGVTPIEYLQNVRIEKAKKLLERTDRNISEIINETGYTDPKSFRKIFLKLVGISPKEYREKFRIR